METRQTTDSPAGQTLAGQPWLAAPGARRVMDALFAVKPDCARFVGGCVRNALIGEPISDIDIATQLEPQAVCAALREAGVAVHETGVEHGTVTAVASGEVFEVTTLRRDVETDGRRAVVAFTEDWGEDARRRDFTVNALYADGEGDVFDPIGRGLDDLRARRIAFIGEAEDRIREDYLRILRFFRFNAWYGDGEPDGAGLAACASLRSGLRRISAERIWSEFKKLLSAKDPRNAVHAMEDAGVLRTVLPDAWGAALLDWLVALDLDAGLDPDPLVRFMALYSRDASRLRDRAQLLRMSNAERNRLVRAASGDLDFSGEPSEPALRRMLYRAGAQAFLDRARLSWAASEMARGDRPPGHDRDRWLRIVTLAQAWRAPEFPLTGTDVMALGVPAGPDVGRILRRIEDWWADHDFPDDVALLARRLKAEAGTLQSGDD